MIEIRDVPFVAGQRFSYDASSNTFYRYHQKYLYYTNGREISYIHLPVTVPDSQLFRFKGFNIFCLNGGFCVFTHERKIICTSFTLQENYIVIGNVLYNEYLYEIEVVPRPPPPTVNWALFESGYKDLKAIFRQTGVSHSEYKLEDKRHLMAVVLGSKVRFVPEVIRYNLYFPQRRHVILCCLLSRYGLNQKIISKIISLF